MSDDQARAKMVDHLAILGCPRGDAIAGVDLAYHAMHEAIATMFRICETGTPQQSIIALQFAPQLLGQSLIRAMDKLKNDAITRNEPVSSFRVAAGQAHG